MLSEYVGFLGAAYLWVKAAHVTFVIFWIAGLFIVPRYYIHHQATTPGSAEDRAWIEREDKARTIILMPAMLITWTLGLMLAVHLAAFDQPWLMLVTIWALALANTETVVRRVLMVRQQALAAEREGRTEAP